MLHEHEEGRNFVKGAAEAIQEFNAGNQAALQTIYKNFNGYAYLLQNHIDKENNILFRMADEAFSNGEQQNLLEAFADIENNIEAEFNPVNSKQKIDVLAAIYLQ